MSHPIYFVKSGLLRQLSKQRWLRIVGWFIAAWLTILLGFSAPSTSTTVPDPLQPGERLYQAEQFTDAIALWQPVAANFARQSDPLNQARTLNAIATAFEQLGDWKAANQAISESLSLLAKLSTSDHRSRPNPVFLIAQALNIQGNLQLRQGKAIEALSSWERAEATYGQIGDAVGQIGSQINQTRALQALGFYRRAATLLEQIAQKLQSQPDNALKVAGLQNLGNVLQRVGDRTRARQVLQQSLAIAERLRNTGQISPTEANTSISSILLSLGNLARSTLPSTAQPEPTTPFSEALTLYRQAADISSSPTLKLKAQAEQLSLFVESAQPTPALDLWAQIQPQLTKLPASRTAIYTRIHLAQTLTQWNNVTVKSDTAQLLATAILQARDLSDRRAESYALGTLGHLYEQSQQWEHARSLTQQALTQATYAPDIAYQWQWQLGRIDCQGTQFCAATGNLQSAITAYSEAVNLLRSLRTDLVAINPDVQFSFQQQVEPVYRQFVELLLQATPSAPSQQNLKQARDVIESLQLAELDNFFRSACLTVRPVQIDQINPQSAVIYPIILPNRLAVILALPNQPLLD
ncbi:hypothetical protein ACKFKF_04865 [Phormidesmis sp. 146-12]